uniref:Uncharacterized protein n=1 Tax=Medicago truncatula TaxID=3880 RepID=A2Q3Y7_MEDTR|nr:hypothetical protein MtrDRAFT_AC155891g17v1 [Medicago truncatula]
MRLGSTDRADHSTLSGTTIHLVSTIVRPLMCSETSIFHLSWYLMHVIRSQMLKLDC